jgi:hypothetical protein
MGKSYGLPQWRRFSRDEYENDGYISTSTGDGSAQRG